MVALNSLVIVGAGPHGQDLKAIVANPVVFFDDDPQHNTFDTSTVMPKDQIYLLGVWDPQVRAKLDRTDGIATQLFHPSAFVDTSVRFFPGVVVWPMCAIEHSVTFGRHVHVGTGAQLVRCKVGHYSTIGNGATICGDVKIGSRVCIGAGAVIKNRVDIYNDAVIGAGAVITKDVGPGEVVVGTNERLPHPPRWAPQPQNPSNPSQSSERGKR